MVTLTVHKEYYALGTDINLNVFSPAAESEVQAGYDLIKHYESLLIVNSDESALKTTPQ